MTLCANCRAVIRAPLTERQHAVYTWVSQFIHLNGYAPSLDEIGNAFGYRSASTVHEHLDTIERKGWITRGFNAKRAITLVEPAASAGQVTT